MAIKIYVDILFLTNLIFDYILLCFTAAFTKSFSRPVRLLAASGAGAFFAVFSFFTVKNVGLTMLVQLVISAVMIILAFGIRDFFGYVRLSAVLYVCTFTLGGACLALVKTDGFVLSGGAFYVDISLTKLLTAGVATYVLSSISYGVVLSKRAKRGLAHKITIEYENQKLVLLGYYDTGNVAKDEQGRGIVIASKACLEPIFKSSRPDFESITVQTVGGKAVLECFVPDKIYSSEEKDETQLRRKIAFSEGILEGDYQLILPNDFFDYN